MKLGLGTVQFGADYGVANPTGRTAEDEVGAILARAWDAGIDVLDTAPAYGDAEAVLGRRMPPKAEFRVVTKTPSFEGRPDPERSADVVERTLDRSLARLGTSRVYGLLAHDLADVVAPGGDALVRRMQEFKRDGRVEKIGVSVYTGREVDLVLQAGWADIVQVPVSVLDQRLVESGHLRRLAAAGVEVHARSVFLQGLLLMEPGSLPAFAVSAAPVLASYRSWLCERKATLVGGALGFLLGLDLVDVAICGVATLAQLEDLLIAARPFPAQELERFALSDDAVLDPRAWPPRQRALR